MIFFRISGYSEVVRVFLHRSNYSRKVKGGKGGKGEKANGVGKEEEKGGLCFLYFERVAFFFFF